MDKQTVPFFVPFFDEDEAQEVVKTIKSNWLTSGPKCAEFEAEIGKYLGDPDIHVITVNSATSGLHLALEALGIGPGDEVLMPTLTFTATAEVVRYLGAKPVFVDVIADTLNIDLALAEAKVSLATKAIMPVHFAGLPVDMDEVFAFAEKHDLGVVEDAAHAFSATSDGAPIGCSKSDAIVFSFYANKTMTTGEGGAIVTRNTKLAQRMRVMRTHGIDRDATDRFTGDNWEYDVVAPGFKYNLTDIAAALGVVQLRKADTARDLRAAHATEYLNALSDLPLVLPNPGTNRVVHAWHIFPIALSENAPIDRDTLVEQLRAAGISISVHFKPLHRLTYLAETAVAEGDSFPVADRHFDNTVTLPLFPGMTSAQRQHVIAALRTCLKG